MAVAALIKRKVTAGKGELLDNLKKSWLPWQ